MAEVKYLNENGLSTVWSKVKGIVTPKADKVSGATNGHLAGLNSSGNLTDSGLPASNIAQKDGSYSGMTVGAAEDLVSAESVASEFTSRITGGSTAVGKGGTALLDRIKGRTLVWNQLENGTWASAFTMVRSGNTYTMSGATGDVLTMSYYKPFISGHKYLVKAHLKINRDTSISGYFYPGYFSSPTQWIGYAISGEGLRSGLYFKNIITAESDKSQLFIGVYHQGTTSKFSASDAVVVSNPQVYDLTLMFGAGSEPATPEEFEALYPLPYYDYNPGALISNATTAIETVGFNQWDEQWEVGSINENGSPASSSTVIRSKNFCRMQSNTVYYATAGGRVDYLVIYFYDANYNLIPYTGAGAYANGYNGTSPTFTSPVGTAYFKFRTSTVYGPVYKNDIMFNLPDPSRNGTYEPYWRSELELNIPTLTGKLNGTGNSVVIFPDGLRSAGTVYDEIVGNKAIKRIGASNLGERSWTLTGDGRGFYTTGLSSLISSNAMVRYICPRYDSVFNSSDSDQIAAADKTISAKTSGNVFIKDSAYTDAATFQAAMSGVTLYYELATPEEYILDEAIPTAMRNDPYGTERRLPEDTAGTVLAPFRADITYSTNIKEAVQSLPQNYININSMQDFLAALGTLMGGTWTMRQADGKFDFTFTPNPSNE